MSTVKLYGRYFSIMLQSRMSYKSSFLMQLVSQFINIGCEFGALWIMFERFVQLAHWKREEVFFIFGVVQCAFLTVECFARGITDFAVLVKDGSFDRFLVRPRPLLFQVVTGVIDFRRLGGILVGVMTLLWSLGKVQIHWDPAAFACLIMAVLGGMSLFFGLFMIEATLAFFTVERMEVANVLTYGGRQLSQQPVDIYPKGFRWLVMGLIPYGLAMHQPLSYLLGKPILDIGAAGSILSPLAGVFFALVMVRLWTWGLGRYQSAGS